jgi:hypothetical protein
MTTRRVGCEVNTNRRRIACSDLATREILVGHRVRDLRGALGDPQRGAFGLREPAT